MTWHGRLLVAGAGPVCSNSGATATRWCRRPSRPAPSTGEEATWLAGVTDRLGGDSPQSLVLCPPVRSIHYVQFDELQKLEKEREGITINYKARLVGSEGLLSGAGADLCE